MATGTVQFQSSTLATPLAGLSVMADAVNDTDHGAGTAQYVKIMDGRTAGTIKASVTSSGLEVDITRVQGTVQALGSVQGVGTFQVLGSVQGVGTFQVLGSVQTVGTSQVLGTVQLHGTNQALGTFQPLAGSVHLAAGSVNAQGVIAHGAVIAGTPLLLGGFGSSGTQAAIADGQLSRIWTDLNGRVQVRGTIDSIPSITVSSMPTVTVTGTVQTHGTSQVLGTVQSHGTNQALGTFQPLAGSVHLASGTVQILGSVQAVGTTQTKEVRSGANFGTRIAGTIGNLIILAANSNRLGAMFYLESGSALFLKLGSNAGTFDYTLQLGTGGYYEVPYNYTGTISGIWQFANGTIQITEVS